MTHEIWNFSLLAEKDVQYFPKVSLFLLEKLMSECEPYGKGAYGSEKCLIFYKTYFMLCSLLRNLHAVSPTSLPAEFVKDCFNPIRSISLRIQTILQEDSSSNYIKVDRFVPIIVIRFSIINCDFSIDSIQVTPEGHFGHSAMKPGCYVRVFLINLNQYIQVRLIRWNFPC